jgi:hypothetical protein
MSDMWTEVRLSIGCQHQILEHAGIEESRIRLPRLHAVEGGIISDGTEERVPRCRDTDSTRLSFPVEQRLRMLFLVDLSFLASIRPCASAKANEPGGSISAGVYLNRRNTTILRSKGLRLMGRHYYNLLSVYAALLQQTVPGLSWKHKR